MKWLKELEKLIDNKLYPNWFERLINNDNPDLGLFGGEISKTEIELIPSAYKYIIFSILEGEYIDNPNDFNTLITEILSKVSFIENPISTLDENHVFILIDYKFFHSIKKTLEFYKRIAKRIAARIYNPNKTYLMEISNNPLFENYMDYFSKKNNDVEKALFDIVFRSLIITETGFFLENDDELFFNLIERKNELREVKTKISDPVFQETIDALIEICTFYQRKLIIRKYQDEEKHSQEYIYEQIETTFNLSVEEHKLKKDYFKNWDEYTQNHYLSDNNDERKRQLSIEIESKSNNEFESFWVTHRKIKYYKDILKNHEKLKKLKNHFKRNHTSSQFDEYARNISKGYFVNNDLSKKLENISSQDLRELFIEINSHQEKCKINNYFPYFKLCEFLKNKVENVFKDVKNADAIDFKLVKEDISFLKEVFKVFKSKLNWSKNHLIYAYQLPYEECKKTIKIAEEEIKIFIPSTFSLPLNYDRFYDFSDEIKSFLVNCETEYKSFENYFKLQNKIIEKEKKLEEILKDQTKKNIELLGIFSAIIALLFQGINTVNSKTLFHEKVLIFILMFVSLFSFLFMIRLFFDTNNKLSKIKYWFELGIFILMFIILLIVGLKK